MLGVRTVSRTGLGRSGEGELQRAAGIRTFIDLTEADELEPYDGVLEELAAERNVEVKHVRHPIRDISVPREREEMIGILRTIRDEIAADRPVYVHCWGGVGRTGTVVGCWLVEEGLSGAEAIARIAELRRHTPKRSRLSPETGEQRDYICRWSASESAKRVGRDPGDRAGR